MHNPVSPAYSSLKQGTGAAGRPRAGRLIIFMHDVLPDRWYDAFIRRATDVPS
jgi:hypothetical protein